MIACDAGRRFGAGVIVAYRLADSVQSVAGFVIGAVFVVVANRGNACHSRITLGALRTHALCPVGHGAAFSASTAHDATVEAWGDAVVISAGLVVRTVVVRLAFRSEALNLGIAG